MISIDRAAAKDALKQVFDQGSERLAAGYWVVIFPEGTRVAPGETCRYKPGGAHLAVRGAAWSSRWRTTRAKSGARAPSRIKPGTITVSIGPPIDPPASRRRASTPSPRPGSRKRCGASRHTATRLPPMPWLPEKAAAPAAGCRLPSEKPAHDRTRRAHGRLCPAPQPRRTIGLTIDHRGLRVGAPPRASLHEVESHPPAARRVDRPQARRMARAATERLQITDGCSCPSSASRCASAWRSAPIAACGTCRRRSRRSPSACAHRQTRTRTRESTARKGPRALRRAPRALRAAAGVTCHATVAVRRAHALGKLQPRSGIRLNWRLIHFPPTGDRLRRRARTGAPARDEPQPGAADARRRWQLWKDSASGIVGQAGEWFRRFDTRGR
jgi:hypothetical protein